MAKNQSKSLNAGRPPLTSRVAKKTAISQASDGAVNARRKSSKATRTLINTHHQLHKSRAAALAAGKFNVVAELDAQIEKLGGLEAYQAASLTGQDKDRGGDSSEKLVEWLHKYALVRTTREPGAGLNLRVLEIGALSSQNVISLTIGKGIGIVKRIDLHSQEPDKIEEIDFMDFPVPSRTSDKYDIVSLSLVLNYVPSAAQRGAMLKRTTQFLRDQIQLPFNVDVAVASGHNVLPLLFVVLPLPCLTNSRYVTQDHFMMVMNSLGFKRIEQHNSQKLAYMLFRWCGTTTTESQPLQSFKKTEINSGKARNNFSIVLETL